MIKELPNNSIWSAGGIGNWQLKMNVMAIIKGGGVRIGLEDNIYFDDDRKQLATNLDLIKRLASIAKTLGKEPYSQKEARKLLCYS